MRLRALLGSAGLLAGACSLGPPQLHAYVNRPAPAGAGGGGGGLGLTSGAGGMCSDEGACGTETHAIQFNAPNLYFVFDTSGSMSTPYPENDPNGPPRYHVVRQAAIALVQQLGPLINVGAAVFPSNHACGPGGERMPTTPGDPFDSLDAPTLTAFEDATDRTPAGGTPTAVTLRAIQPSLAKLTGKTVVFVLTDGGPNCDPDLSCSPGDCTAYLDGVCAENQGCCDPSYTSKGGGPVLCLDHDATVAAIGSIHAMGIDVYTIGVADLQAYRSMMNDMAVAGGTAQAGPVQYIDAKDLGTLGVVFAQIAAANISCDLKLDQAPSNKNLTNVYFGCTVVPYDAEQGWSWKSDDEITLNGGSCTLLKSGHVTKLKVITGCPTQMPK